MSKADIEAKIKEKYPTTGEDVNKYVEGLKNATIEGENLVNPFVPNAPGSLSRDNYILYNQHQADKKTSVGEAFGIAKDTFKQVRDELATGIGTAAYKTYQGEGVEVAKSLGEGMTAGMVGTYDILNKIFDPVQRIPNKEDFVGKRTTRLVDNPNFPNAYPMEVEDVNTEEDYNKLVDAQMQRDADMLNRLYAMESTMRGASIPEVARGGQFADPFLAAGLGGALVKVALKGGKTLITKAAANAAAKAAARTAGTEGVETAAEATARTAAQGADNVPSPMVSETIESGGTVPFTPDPTAPIAATQGVPLMVTRDMKQQLLDRGFTGSQIDAMRPQEAWNVLNPPAAFPSTAPGPMAQAGLRAAESTAGAVQFTAGLPSQGLKKLGEFVESVAPGMGTTAQGGVLGGSVIVGGGAPAAFLAKAKATEKVAEFLRSFARVSQQEASRAGRLERVALDPLNSPVVRKAAAGLAQFQPIARTVIDLSKGALKGGAAGSVVGGALGGLAERDLEGFAAGMGAGTALGGFTGTLHAGFDIGKEAFGGSTLRTRTNATGDINRFIASRPEMEQAAWSDAMRILVEKIGPERAASQMDALRVAEASGVKLRIATPDENKLWKAPGWLDPDKGELVLNPPKVRAGTPAHEATHAIIASNVKRQYRAQIEEAIYGIPDPVTGEIVKPGFLDDAALARVAEQISESYRKGDQKIAADRFKGLANNLKNSTDKESLIKARSDIADEIAADYGDKFFDRVRAGRFNPDRLPLVYRNALNAIDDGIFNTFKSVVFERGMDLGFDNTTKSFRDANGKPIRVPQLDEIFKRAYSQKSSAETVVSKKPDLIPVHPADRAIWAKTYGGARGILNEDNTPKSSAQVAAEAAARWQNMVNKLSPLPESERMGIEFSRDKSGKTTMTAKGQLSPAALTAILESDMLDQSANAVLRDVIISMQNPDKSTFDTRYYKAYERGQRSGKMVAGVYPPSHNEILPYAVTMNSKQGVNIKAVDITRVRQRLATALNKPQFKDLYSNPADALKDFKRYLENATQVMPVSDSATLFGGGAKGSAKRNLFYEALGFRLRNGESLLNVPDSVINKSQDTIKDYRVERFAKLVDSGNKFAFEEATTFERAMKNFQPDAFTPEALPNGEAYTNPDGFRILNKTGSKLFRTYDDTGKLIGVAESKDKAVKKAMDEATKRVEKEEMKANEPESSKRFQPGLPGDIPQQGLENHPLKPILGNAFAFNPKKINEKYIRQANESAERLGGGSAFNPSRKSGDDGQAKLQLDGIRSSEIRTSEEIDRRISEDSPNGKLLAGGEHFVFIPDNKDYVIKTTQMHPRGNSGFTVDENVGKDFSTSQFRFLGFRPASISEYVARTAEFSKIFNIPWQVVEIAQNKNGDPVIYSKMKKIEGTPLDDSNPNDRKAVKELMTSKGFEYLGDSYLTFGKGFERLEGISYFNPKTGVLISDAEPRNFVRTKSDKIEPVDLMINKFPLEYNIKFQPDPTSPNILNGSDGSRIIKSTSGKYRVYLATGALAGVKDTLESAKKLIERKSK
jgi:hypothetical protein